MTLSVVYRFNDKPIWADENGKLLASVQKLPGYGWFGGWFSSGGVEVSASEDDCREFFESAAREIPQDNEAVRMQEEMSRALEAFRSYQTARRLT